MKPTTKIEKQMCALALTLPQLPQQLVQEGFDAFKSYGYTVPRRGRKVEVWCQCCGHRQLTRGTLVELTDYVCPQCHSHLELREHESKRSDYHGESHWRTYIDTFEGLLVARTFQFDRINSGDRHTVLAVNEIYQNWAAPNGREVITSRPYTRSIFGESFDFSKPFWIAKHNSSYTGQYGFDDMFDPCSNSVFATMNLSEDMQRDGFTPQYIAQLIQKQTNFIAVAARMQTDVAFRTAMKTGYDKLAMHIAESGVKFPSHVFKILHRNHYQPKDVNMFCEYIADCVFCGVDTHNAHYVCPADLREAHQTMMRRKVRIEGERALKKKREQVVKEEPAYRKLRAAFFGLVFQAGGIKVFTAPSVASIYAEGCAMHHCVFANAYYKNPTSLIMFARDAKTGDPLETVEVNLRTFQIAQSRGLQNKFTPQHKDICALVNANMNQIRQAAGMRPRKQA